MYFLSTSSYFFLLTSYFLLLTSFTANTNSRYVFNHSHEVLKYSRLDVKGILLLHTRNSINLGLLKCYSLAQLLFSRFCWLIYFSNIYHYNKFICFSNNSYWLPHSTKCTTLLILPSVATLCTQHLLTTCALKHLVHCALKH